MSLIDLMTVFTGIPANDVTLCLLIVLSYFFVETMFYGILSIFYYLVECMT